MENTDRNTITKRILSKVEQGDKIAFERLYNLYKIQVYNFCFSMVKSKDDSEEVVQDTFLQIWRSRDQLSEIKSFNGFIYRIAKNKTLNKIRKKVGEPSTYENIEDSLISLNQTENEVLYKEMHEILDAAIEALPTRRQEIFRMSRDEGLSNNEIAMQLNISIHTVKSQMTKALSYLKSYIDWATVFTAVAYWLQ
ncbi:MAG: RNA polymerase sigma-70 factor [Reichenbachiella sp.]